MFLSSYLLFFPFLVFFLLLPPSGEKFSDFSFVVPVTSPFDCVFVTFASHGLPPSILSTRREKNQTQGGGKRAGYWVDVSDCSPPLPSAPQSLSFRALELSKFPFPFLPSPSPLFPFPSALRQAFQGDRRESVSLFFALFSTPFPLPPLLPFPFPFFTIRRFPFPFSLPFCQPLTFPSAPLFFPSPPPYLPPPPPLSSPPWSERILAYACPSHHMCLFSLCSLFSAVFVPFHHFALRGESKRWGDTGARMCLEGKVKTK